MIADVSKYQWMKAGLLLMIIGAALIGLAVLLMTLVFNTAASVDSANPAGLARGIGWAVLPAGMGGLVFVSGVICAMVGWLKRPVVGPHQNGL